MTTKAAAEIRKAWAASKRMYVVVVEPGALVYVESPEESGHLQPPEGLIRVFTDQASVTRYRDAVAEYDGADGNSIRVLETTPEMLFESLPGLNANHKREAGYGLCVEFSVMPRDGWAREIDTLWSPRAPKN